MIDANPAPELMPAIILAGGLATRLRPLTHEVPKALIEVAGHPFLWHQLRLLKRNNIRHVVLAVGYLGEKIQERFGNGSDLGIRIDYSFDGPVLLGTAGAIRRALPLLPHRFFVLYGDSYLTCDYRSVQNAFVNSGLPGLMTIYENDGNYDASNVEYNGRRILKYNKQVRTPGMRHIDYGLGAFEKSVFAEIPSDSICDLAAIYQKLLQEGKLAVFVANERFYEIGSLNGLQETERLLRLAVTD
ncbi:MAG TPA: nucleotidyltransferase family protein [Terriglobales bacterium]